MVDVRLPPPRGAISPQFKQLKAGVELIRIYDPTKYRATATGFRYFGPISRFDHQISQKNRDSQRGIIYLGLTLSCCLVEIFGDGGVVEIKEQEVALITLNESLNLLDLVDSAAMRSGTVAAISSITQRNISQAWGKYFYEHPELYSNVDGLIYSGAHNGELAIALYERAKLKIETSTIKTLRLDSPSLLQAILEIAEINNLIVT